MDRWDEVFDLLERSDKWYLGGGLAMHWAPKFPRFLDVPGFWDPATYYHVPVGPLFTVTLLSEHGRPLPVKPIGRRWRVSHLMVSYELGEEFTMVEHRSLSPEDVLVSELEIKSNTREQHILNVVVWTAQSTRADRPNADFVTAVRTGRDRIVLAHQINDGKGKPVLGYCQALGSIRDPDSSAVNLAEDGAELPPVWELTPFSEKFNEKGLPRQSVTKGGPAGSLSDCTVYVAMHYRLIVPSGTVRKFSVGVAVARAGTEATRNLKRSLGVHSPADRATRSWRQFFQQVPYFRCSDPYIERCYWYRWYGLRLNMVLPADYGPKHPCVFEGVGPGWFRHPISYSAHVHMRELRWCHDKSAAQGSLLNFVEAQRRNGEFPSGLGVEFPAGGRKGIYHANWGRAVRELYAIHPDKTFLKSVYEPLVRYARYFTRYRDKENSGLFDVTDQGETGQEYSSRYQFVDPEADTWKEIRLKGVDATVYLYELFRALAWMAGVLGKRRDVNKWNKLAEETCRAVRSRMFDPAGQMFVDVRPETGERSPVKAAVGFYPFATDIATTDHLEAVHRNLLDPKAFWTEFPVPTVSMDDPHFSATGEWKQMRMRCPWNGRSWLMTSSHVAEALAEAAVRLDENLRVRASELLRNLIRMTFIDRDPARPTSYEYYNSLNGHAPFFRGVDDYMHSYIADLILRYVCGLRPDADGVLTVDPFPFGLKKVSVNNVKIRGKEIALDMIAGRGRLLVGRQPTRFVIGRPVTVDLAQKKKR
ncbi:MAG TPA: hypothetical protein VMZ92_10715 [Planctomycetota bacterium]|nr:hypothetical protein [Planctomycetota bacterium]